MRPINGFVAERSGGAKYPQLPVGAYVARIKNAWIEGNEPDQKLVLRVDIEEGPHAGYYFSRWKHEKENSRFEPKYKGDYKLRIPNENNTKALYPEKDMKRLKDAAARLEESNPGYHWDWKEDNLKGLLIGINVVEDEYNGHKFTKIFCLETVDDVRNGRCQIIQLNPRGDADDSQFIAPVQQTIDQQSGFTAVETDELPF